MEKQVIYGVFAMDVELPKVTNKKKELEDLAEAMQSMSKKVQERGRFIKAYKKLEDAVAECYGSNGYRLSRLLETPEGVINAKFQTFYFPKLIEVNVEY